MSNWFNWYTWWLPEEKADIDEENISAEEAPIEAKPEEAPTEETTPAEEPVEEKPKPKRKRRAAPKKVSSKTQDSIELVLRPSILEELEQEAIISDSTINQVIQVILEAHFDSKETESLLQDTWKCNYCQPEKEFKDYFGFSEHFFSEHMQPGLQKISEYNKEE